MELSKMPLSKAGLLLVASLAAPFASTLLCQDSPSLGDVARQARQQKQDKDSPNNKDGNAAKASKVITNEEISSGSHTPAEVSNSPSSAVNAPESPSGLPPAKQSAESWKSQILAQKQSIGALQAEISKLNDSIQYAPSNCVSGCVQWNERQQQKQQEVERMHSQLDTLNQHLQEMQEAARQQGYGSSVYDP
jgi:predicted RNase H-like nuclease (RuvC/YqgF family)